MFFEGSGEIPKLAERSGTTIFAVGRDIPVKIRGAIIVEPAEGKSYISIDQIREVIEMTRARQTRDRYFVFREAEKMREDAENALLKLLEEPRENYHFVLLTESPEALLPTILSRAEIYYPKVKKVTEKAPKAEKKVLEDARKLLVISAPRDFIEFSDKIHKKKDERGYALEVLAVAVEIAYKSYLKTGKRGFLVKIPKLIEAHKNISSNGNVRLHLVADLC